MTRFYPFAAIGGTGAPASGGGIFGKMNEGVHGAKVALLIGGKLLVILRDDIPTILWPGHWDFPGGGREGDETPEETVRRETFEEVGLTLRGLSGGSLYQGDEGPVWFFVATLPEGSEEGIVFGDEGQRWALMTFAEYEAHPKRIPHLAERFRAHLQA
ncbi:MAG: NUDIX hydrolase [Shimia sp.]